LVSLSYFILIRLKLNLLNKFEAYHFKHKVLNGEGKYYWKNWITERTDYWLHW